MTEMWLPIPGFDGYEVSSKPLATPAIFSQSRRPPPHAGG